MVVAVANVNIYGLFAFQEGHGGVLEWAKKLM